MKILFPPPACPHCGGSKYSIDMMKEAYCFDCSFWLNRPDPPFDYVPSQFPRDSKLVYAEEYMK